MSAGFTQSPQMAIEATPELLVATLQDMAVEEQLRTEVHQRVAGLAEAQRSWLYEGRGKQAFRFPEGSNAVPPETLATIGGLTVDIEAARQAARAIQTPTTHRDEVVPGLELSAVDTLALFDGQMARFTSRVGTAALHPITMYKTRSWGLDASRRVQSVVGRIDYPQRLAGAAHEFDGGIYVKPRGWTHALRDEVQAVVEVITPASLRQYVDIEFLH